MIVLILMTTMELDVVTPSIFKMAVSSFHDCILRIYITRISFPRTRNLQIFFKCQATRALGDDGIDIGIGNSYGLIFSLKFSFIARRGFLQYIFTYIR